MTTTRIAQPSSGHRLPLGALAALFLVALSGLVLLAACGGDDEEGTRSTDETRTPAATASAGETQTPAATASPAAEETATAAPAASGGEFDPCSLLTKAEVEAAIGTSVTEPEAEGLSNLFTCSYNDPETPLFSLVTVSVFVGENADQASDVYELTKDNAADAQEVDGIGDEAFWDDILNGLEVLEGKYDIRIDVSPDDGDELAIAKDLAAKAVDSLP
jgi:hypothetical protein